MNEISGPSPRTAPQWDRETVPHVQANPLMRALLGHPRRPRLSVLIYHRVMERRDPLRPTEPTASEFEARMKWVKAHFNVLPLGDAVAGLNSDRLPDRPLSITFDDGYADNHDMAMPILRNLGLPATFFVSTGYLDGGRMFNDTVIETVRRAKGDVLDASAQDLGVHPISTDAERCIAIGAILGQVMNMQPTERHDRVEALAAALEADLPTDMMMTSTQVVALHRAGMEIGGHTVNHPVLAAIPIDDASREISEGRRQLERITGSAVRLFAYPRGRPKRDYTATHVRLVRELGFEAAVSTAWGVCGPEADPFQIPRFTPWDPSSWKFGLRLAMNLQRCKYETA